MQQKPAGNWAVRRLLSLARMGVAVGQVNILFDKFVKAMALRLLHNAFLNTVGPDQKYGAVCLGRNAANLCAQ